MERREGSNRRHARRSGPLPRLGVRSAALAVVLAAAPLPAATPVPLPASWLAHFSASAETWLRAETGIALLRLDVTGDGLEELFVAPTELSGSDALEFRVYSPCREGTRLCFLGEFSCGVFAVRYDPERGRMVTLSTLPSPVSGAPEAWLVFHAFDGRGIHRVGRQPLGQAGAAVEAAIARLAAWRRETDADLVRLELPDLAAALGAPPERREIPCSSLWGREPCDARPWLAALDRTVVAAEEVVTPFAAHPEQGQALDALLAPAFAGRESGGVVLIARAGEVVYRRAWGKAEIALGVPMRPDHLLAVGSITKQFTAVALLRLVAAGVVALEDDVRAHVPEVDTGGRRATVEQVLTHTAGLPNLVDRSDFERLARLPATAVELLGLTRGVPLHFEPGQGFRYSDSGYILLGEIVARASGEPFGRHLEERLFRPLGLRDTWYGAGDRLLPRRARGYSVRDSETVEAAPLDYSAAHGAGGVLSTADDLLRWSRALAVGAALPRDLTRRAWSPRTLPDGTRSGYGFGWQLCELAGRATREHGGFVPGFSANALHVAEEELDVIVLLNNDTDPDAGRLARASARLLLTGAPAPAVAPLDARRRAALAGRYRTGGGARLEFVDRDAALELLRGDRTPQPLVALSPLELTTADGDDALVYRFELGADGRAARVRWSLRCEPVGSAEREGP